MGKIITFTNQKGGVGKTTTCVNLSAYVAKLGYKVLLVDLDPQGNASSGVAAVKTKGTPSVYSVLSGQMEIEDKGLIQETKVAGLDVLPSTIDLAGAEIELAKIGREQGEILAKKLAPAKEIYDYIMIDCPPSLGLLTVNSLTASDSVLIPIQCEFFALEGLSQLINTVKIIKRALNPSLEIEGVLLTMYDPRSKLTLQVADEIKKYFNDKLFDTRIPRNIRLAEAPSFGLPILLYDKRSQGGRAYEELANEFLRKEKKKSKL
ncbi:MAG: AAA family ATPase [Clostridiales bacterium]|jgi:chromosome partitioning protein|nr:AAA family ATPase [Clostridiales bacterium]